MYVPWFCVTATTVGDSAEMRKRDRGEGEEEKKADSGGQPYMHVHIYNIVQLCKALMGYNSYYRVIEY